jgi:hypothetical protein
MYITNILLPKPMEGQVTINQLKQFIKDNEGKVLTKELIGWIISHVESVLRSFPDISTTLWEEAHSGKLTSQEVQELRNQVLRMLAAKKPLDGIPSYQGKRSVHGDPLSFFMKHYEMYVKAGQEVIFAPELKVIDEKLLIALRNHTKVMPLGDRSQRTEAISIGRFKDDSNSLAKASVAMARRLERTTIFLSQTHRQLSLTWQDELDCSEQFNS